MRFSVKEIIKKNEITMQKSLDFLTEEYKSLRVGRANPSILDKISVDYYGTMTPINQISSISINEARILNVQPWDISLLAKIEKAIQKADIGVFPQNDGKVIRIVFPPLSEDRRKELAKKISLLAENCKVGIRLSRHDGLDKIKKMKKNGEINEGDIDFADKKIQQLTDNFIKKIDSLKEAKVKQVMEV
ncbi:MAG: ribosome recycling factor [Oscillospiraceae bacterium]|jgi:ribosome recycling factor|nr:ribosome recycling factor [Oscillospiraceae bacterium]